MECYIHQQLEKSEQTNKRLSLKNKFKKGYFIGAMLLLLVILSFLFYSYYLNKVTIYEPLTISVSGLTYIEQKTINVYSTTPLNRKANIYYSNSEMAWQSYYSFIKSVELIIPDSLSKKITGIEVLINNIKFDTKLIDFQCKNIGNYKHCYHLPAWIKSERSFFKMIESVFYWHYMQLSLKILFAIAILLLLFIKKLKRWIFSALLFLPINNFILVSKAVDWILSRRTQYKWIFTFIISLFIACSLFFGYLLFKYVLVTFVSAILFIIWNGLLIWLVIGVIVKIFKISWTYSKNVFVIFIIFLILLMCIESFLRIMDIGSSYNEKIGLYYSSGFIEHQVGDKQSKGLWVHPKYSSNVDKKKEFSDTIKCNAEGLRDFDHPLDKDSGEYRIICLGNSFTEGIGAPQDSAWPKVLEKRLILHTKKKVTVFNAGISGSDPFFEYMLMERKMLKYNPDLILLALGSSDFEFYRFRGGFERFTADGYKFRKAPYWEGFYALSYIFRFIINDILKYENFLSPAAFNADRIKATKDIEDCIFRFYNLSIEKHFNFRVIFVDDGNNKYNPLIYKLKKESIIPVFDMFEYNNKIKKMNPEDRNKYYWPIDGHCNSKGYNIMAEGVEWFLMKNEIIDSLN